ncbi:MAG: NifB/NifX family molybdenum-iron cluster-binding protein [Desulfobacterales bacterium]|jgi:predicted Fe-Mo cluster-binding NifX family protein
MKIAVSSTGKNMDSQLDPRFGRCAYYLVVDSDDMHFEVYPNESAAMGGGAGIQASQFLASKGVQVVITGNCGPNAVDTLLAAGIELFTGEQGTIRDVVEKYVTGNLKPTNKPTVDSHFGMGAGTGTGRGIGVRRGMGGRRGMGSGFKTSGNRSIRDKVENNKSGNQELENLKEQAEILNQQLKGILTRINNLEKI